MKRIYWQTIKKWALIVGIPTGVAGFTLLFIYLSALGVIDVTGYSGDMMCAGTELDPCLAYINFTTTEDIFIYPIGYDPWGRDTPFETDIGLKDWKIYRSWGTGWREIKLNETCKYTWCGAPPKSPDNKYAFAFRKGRNYQIKIVALKDDPKEDIKWGFGPVDPVWYGTEKYKVSFELSKNSISKKCLDIQIQNLQDSADNLDIETILNETNFDVNQVNNIQFFEWKSEEVLKYNYTEVCNPYNETIGNEINLTEITIENCTQIITGNYTEEVWSWKDRQLTFTDKEGKTELKNTWEQVPIQKAGNKDTKKFRLCFDVPIVEASSGWGNKGTIYLDLNNEIFVDKTHSSWWDSDWDKCKDMNITGGSSTLTDFPFYVNVTYDSDMQADFDDIRFVNGTCQDSGSEMDYEIDYKVNSNYAEVWIKTPTLTTGTNQYSMYYDNAVGSGEDASAVWSNNYKAVWHHENETAGATNLVDNIAGTHNGTGKGEYVPGLFGSALNYNAANNNYTSIPDHADWDGSAVSISLWINPNEGGTARGIFDRYVNSGGAGDAYEIVREANGTMRFRIGGNLRIFSDDIAPTDSWTHYVAVWDGSDIKQYVNGTLQTNTLPKPGSIVSTKPIWLATQGGGVGGQYRGLMDEVRYSNVARTSNWLNRSYNNIDFSFFVFGDEETFAEPDAEYPIFSDYKENPSSNTIYSLGATYEFNVTITSTNETAGLDFNSFNYSASNISSVFNTTISDLAAGTYLYYWWAYGNGSLTHFNTSGERSYTVAQATPVITKKLNGVDDNLTIQHPQQINVTGSTDVGELTIYRDGINVTSEKGLNVSLASGYYLYGFNVTFEDNQNYSNLSEELYANITKAIGEVFMYINNLRANYTVELPNNRNIWLISTLKSGIGNIELWLNGTLYNNGTSPISNQTNLSFGFYNATAVYSGNINYTSDSEVWWINVSGVKSVNLSLEGYFSNLDVELGTNITVNATTNTLDLVCVDVDHPDYGVNYSCSDWEIDGFELFVNYFRKILFSDGSSEKTFNFTLLNGSIDEGNLSINAHQYDEVDGLSFNISGTGRNILFYLVNTSILDRAYQGKLIGENIYQNKFSTELNYSNLTYSNPGGGTVYIYLDDNADVINFTLNVTGIEYGFDYFDPLDNWDNIDESLTTAQLDKGGVILLGNSSLTEFSFDDFEDGTIASHWIYTANDTSPPITVTTMEINGYIQQLNAVDGRGNVGTNTMNIYPKADEINLYSSENINFALYSNYNADGDDSGDCWGAFSRVKLATSNIWTNKYLPDNDATEHETSTANVIFNLTKHNKTAWRVQISGSETSTVENDPCDTMSALWNWTAGTSYITRESCANVPGSLDNDFYISMDYINYAIEISSSISVYEGCSASSVVNRIYYVNNSLWYRSNSSVTSKSIFDSSSNIAKATFSTDIQYFTGDSYSAYDLFLSADDGENWEDIDEGVEYSFSNPGKHIKWRINFTTTTPGYAPNDIFVINVSISTEKGFPINVSFDFGDDDIIDYEISGNLNSTNSPYTIELTNADFSGALISSYQLFNHTYGIPLVITSDSVGQLNLDTLNLTYNPNPVILDIDYIQNFLDASSGFVNFSIPFSSPNEGNITIKHLNYDYAGGNDTISVLAHNLDYSINLSRNLTYFYSGFYKNLPYTWTGDIFFLPRTNSSKNVSAYGQTSSKPIFNITTTNYGGRNLNLSIRLNESNSCLNITFNRTGYGTPINQKINTTWRDIFFNLEYLNNSKVWFWADLENCNPADKRILRPSIQIESYCDSCFWEAL